MEWLNASVTFLKSAEMLRSRMEQRGAWLTLMTYCIQQENGGRLAAVEDWSDWDWQNVLGVPKKLTKEDSFLWQWEDGGTLVLQGYPTKQEAQVRAQREGGKKGGLSSAVSRAASSPSRLPSSSPESIAATKRKGKERKEKEEERKDTGGADAPVGGGPLLSIWLTHARGVYPDWPEVDATAAWAHYDGIGWVNASGHPVRSWQSCVITCYTRWLKGVEKISERVRGGAAPEFDAEKPNAHTGGLPVFDGAEVQS